MAKKESYKGIGKTYRGQVKEPKRPYTKTKSTIKKLKDAAAKGAEKLKGNEYWRLRTSVGMPALFTEPLKLLQAAEEYFSMVIENPLYKVEAKVISNKIKFVHTPVQRPFTISGFCVFLNVGVSYWSEFKKSVTGKKDAFPQVIAIIESTMYNQKFDGAASGFFNANIIARDLGLRDNTDVTTNGKDLPPAGSMVLKVFNTAPPLSNAEADVDTKKV